MNKFLSMVLSKIDNVSIKVIRSLSVKARFFMMVIIISIIPILVIGVISYQKANKDIISKISVQSLQVVKQMSTLINGKLLNWQEYGNIIANSTNVQDILEEFGSMNESDQYLASKAIQKTMKESLKVSLDIMESDIITDNGRVISPMSYPNLNTSPFISYMDDADEVKKITKEANGSYIWYTDDIAKKGYKGLIVLSRSILDLNTFKKSLGYLMLRVDTNYLYSLYEDVNLGRGSKIYIVDSRFLVVLSDNKAEVGTRFSSEISRSIQTKFNEGIMEGTIKGTNSKYLTAFSRIPESRWTVIALIPNTYLDSLANDIKKIVETVGIICIFVSLLFFLLIYRSITFPLGKLIHSMREVEKGNLESSSVNEDARDEVGEVTLSYNRMIEELNNHIEKIKAKEKQKATAEFRALQAQINPHFIANTLNNVVWLAKMQKAENIETVVTSLICLLNGSMGRGEDVITIREEILNIKSYVSIQEFKYFKKIDMHFEVDNDILDYKILKFILQPVIENSIIHGIGPKQGQGIISLKGYIDDDCINITVTDTGVGMDQSEIEKLFNGEKASKDRFNSIGLSNVNERIRLAYGENYGLRIKSEKDVFTSVGITLPVIS